MRRKGRRASSGHPQSCLWSRRSRRTCPCISTVLASPYRAKWFPFSRKFRAESRRFTSATALNSRRGICSSRSILGRTRLSFIPLRQRLRKRRRRWTWPEFNSIATQSFLPNSPSLSRITTNARTPLMWLRRKSSRARPLSRQLDSIWSMHDPIAD